MQSQHLKLKEIIWEITGECKNGCSYCGSKDVLKSKTSNEKIVNIAKEIAKYPPEEIDISGGDPLLVNIQIHDEVLSIFKEHGIICKILVNPNSLIKNDKINQDALSILKLYDWVGISVNTKQELESLKAYLKTQGGGFGFTVITNFNIQNLYDFDEIERFVKQNNNLWTIQFTVYEEKNHPLALYSPDNQSAFETLKKKVEVSSTRILLSDNIRKDVSCGAGKNSVGITHDGLVIPCLSMRSWTKPTEKEECYNIFSDSLESIWINGFKAQRFTCFKCCKDSCNNLTLEQRPLPKDVFINKNTSTIQEIVKSQEKIDWEKLGKSIKINKMDNVVMYGVQIPYRTPDDFPNTNVYAYAVSIDFNNFTTPTQYTNSPINDELKNTSTSNDENKEKE